jgi:hypothetical protein
MAGILIDTAFNAFYDGLTRIEKGTGVVTPTQLQSKNLMVKLSRSCANSDFTGAYDCSAGAANIFGYLTTAACTIHQLKIHFNQISFANTTIQSNNVWLGGAAAKNPGFIWGVGISGTATPATFYSTAATTIKEFGTLWGADIHRVVQGRSATPAENVDSLLVTVDMKKRFGHPLLLASGVYIGVYCAEDLSTSGLTITGTVNGKFV